MYILVNSLVYFKRIISYNYSKSDIKTFCQLKCQIKRYNINITYMNETSLIGCNLAPPPLKIQAHQNSELKYVKCSYNFISFDHRH